MIIKNIQLFNFRCFRELKMTFHGRLTVLVAPNGGGKTTILDAVASILSVFVGQFDGTERQMNKDDDIRVVKKEDGTRALVVPSTIEATFEIAGETQSWGRTLMATSSQQPDYTPAAEYGKTLLAKLRSEAPNDETLLPVVAYYNSRRTAESQEYKVSLEFGSAALMREQGYADCLTGSANVNLFRTWYGHAALAELSVQQKLGKQPVSPSEMKLAERARAVKEVVNAVLSGASEKQRYWLDLYLWMKQVGVLDTVQNVELGLNQLSDGVQCMLSMAGDLAARCAVLNPHFGPDAPAKTPGIVLIDEVDLHLHPAWQQRVLEDLQRAFPLVQFIVTTHSPQVLTTVRREHVRLLAADGTVAVPDEGTYGAESSRVLEEVFGVHVRPQSVETVASLREYLAMVEKGKAKTPEALSMRIALEDALGKHDPDLHLADIRASQLELLGRR